MLLCSTIIIDILE